MTTAEMKSTTSHHEPRGFGEHTRGLASGYAHELGWRLNEDERRRINPGRHNTDGGTDYKYGARDFGDEPVNMEASGVLLGGA